MATVWLFAGVLLTRYDLALFVGDLRMAGAEVELPTEPAFDRGMFPVPPHHIRVNNQDLQVFEFSSNLQAMRASCHVLSNGSTIAPMDGTLGLNIDWSYPPPTWYRKGQLIVINGRNNSSGQAIIEKLLGFPFTGGSARGAACVIPL